MRVLIDRGVLRHSAPCAISTMLARSGRAKTRSSIVCRAYPRNLEPLGYDWVRFITSAVVAQPSGLRKYVNSKQYRYLVWRGKSRQLFTYLLDVDSYEGSLAFFLSSYRISSIRFRQRLILDYWTGSRLRVGRKWDIYFDGKRIPHVHINLYP